MFGALSRYLSGISAAFRTKVGRGPLFVAAAAAEQEVRLVGLILPAAKAGILAARDAIVEAAVARVAAATPIAELAAFGARVAPLSAAGFRVVADLRGHGMASLMAREGIGEVTAGAAITAAQAFLEQARADVRLMPDPDERRPGDAALLLAVVRYETLLRELPPRAEPLAKRQQALASAVRVFRDGTVPAEHLFSGAKRTARAAEEARLQAEADWVLAEARILNRYARELTFDEATVWKRYNENAAAFIALLEGVMSATAPAPGSPRVTVGLPDQRGGLPAEIADAVEATQLDLTLLTATLRRYQLFGAQ